MELEWNFVCWIIGGLLLMSDVSQLSFHYLIHVPLLYTACSDSDDERDQISLFALAIVAATVNAASLRSDTHQ